MKLNSSTNINKRSNSFGNILNTAPNNENNSPQNNRRTSNSSIKNNRNSSTLILPRIPSAGGLTSQKNFLMKPISNEISTLKRERLPLAHNNKNRSHKPKTISHGISSALFPKPPQAEPNISDIRNLEKENLSLIRELQEMNQELTNLVLKNISNAIVPKNKAKLQQSQTQTQPQSQSNTELEIMFYKKYLTSLINEYNNLCKLYSNANDPTMKEKLELQLTELQTEYNQYKNINDDLKKKIIKNETYLSNFEHDHSNFLIGLECLQAKYDLYKTQLIKKTQEKERMEKLISSEKQKISDLQLKYNKLQEILLFYEETPVTLNQKEKSKIKHKQKMEEINSLEKKKKILIHAHSAMKANYTNEIDKQMKYINQLKLTIKEIDNILNNIQHDN